MMTRIKEWLLDHVAIILILLVGIGFVWQDAQRIGQLRDGCERQNPRSQTLFLNTLRDAEAREAAAPDLNPAIGLLAKKGYGDAQELLDSLEAVSVWPGGDDNPELTEADAVGMIADCSLAYPHGFPVNIFAR